MPDDSTYRGPNGETYWGEPITDDEKHLVAHQQLQALFGVIGPAAQQLAALTRRA